MKTLKWALLGVGGLALLAIVAAVVVVATFDPNDYKPRIVDLVKRQTGRTLTIDGKIGLTLFPRIGASVGAATLSEPNRATIFARVESAHVAVALLPLLSRRVMVDRVTLTGLAADLVRHKDGGTNVDDLTGARSPGGGGGAGGGKTPGPPFAVEVNGFELKNAALGWRDERDGTSIRLSGVSVETGRLAHRAPGKLSFSARVESAQPKAALQVGVEAGYLLDIEKPGATLSAIDVKVSGDAAGLTGLDARLRAEAVEVDPGTSRVTVIRGSVTVRSRDGLDATASLPRLALSPDGVASDPMTGDFALVTPARRVSAKARLAAFTGTPTQLRLARADLDLDVTQGDLAVRGTLGAAVALDLAAERADLARIAGDLAVTVKGAPDRSRAIVSGAARADWRAESASGDLVVKLDDSQIEAKVGIAHWSRPAISFDVTADRLNLDRYLPAVAAPAPARRAVPAGQPPAADGKPPAAGTRDDARIDFLALVDLTATGTARIGALQARNVKAERVALTVKAAGGALDVEPISASLYQGTLSAGLSVRPRERRVAYRQKLTGVSLGPLLRDAGDADLLEGRGDFSADVSTVGDTVRALTRGLAGTASVAVKDGAIKGVDLVGIVRSAQSLLGARQTLEQLAQGGAKTDFSDLTASFAIKNGVAHNEDLQVKSPLVRVTGRGDVDLAEGTANYTVKTALVANAPVPGAKDLGALSLVAVPVQATGPLDKLKYRVDLQALATELATGTVRSGLEQTLKRFLGKPK